MNIRRSLAWLVARLASLQLAGCGYNDFQRLDEQVKAAWAEVLNQYQRRADLIPNIVASVKGEANFEQETLTKVIEARASATSACTRAKRPQASTAASSAEPSTPPPPSTSSTSARAVRCSGAAAAPASASCSASMGAL